ncbi:MAG: glutamate--tRNA ligase family protein, partial [Massilia sp.]
DWLLATLSAGGFFKQPVPRQYEFARLNLTYVVTSKRKLRQLVDQGIVSGWDDPRMPTIVGLRRRGYTPESIQLFCERIGVSKADGWIDMSTLEGALRDDLDPKAPRATAVLRPLKLIIDNYPVGQSEECTSPVHPHFPERGVRTFPITRELWIEQDDFMEAPVKGYFRLFPPIGDAPGSRVRLRHGYVVECTGFDKDADGAVTAVHVKYFEDSRSGTPGSDTYKVKGNIHWVSTATAVEAEVRLYDRLFTEAQPDAGGKDFIAALNPKALETVTAYLEPGMREAQADQRYQFERHGYFVADRVDSQPGKPVFNRITTLKDSWK